MFCDSNSNVAKYEAEGVDAYTLHRIQNEYWASSKWEFLIISDYAWTISYNKIHDLKWCSNYDVLCLLDIIPSSSG